jgi:hypothetical protein
VVQQVATVSLRFYLEENLKVREQQTSGTSHFMESEMNLVKASLMQSMQRSRPSSRVT